MTDIDGMYRQVQDIARKVILEAQKSGGKMSAAMLAGPMMQLIDPDQQSPDLAAYCTRANCVQHLGLVLRREYGTVNNPVAETFDKQLDIRDFVDCLQTSYPVPGPVAGDEHTEYKPIDSLTDDEVTFIANRMGKIGDKYHKHRDQFLRYHRARARRSA